MTSYDLVEMEILGLSSTPGGSGAYALILTECDGRRRLPIIIGAFEAQAIALELEHIKPPRPMTHDLIREVFVMFDATVSDVIIHELTEGTFFAKIRFEKDGELLEMDSRPSDAIAVAIRFNARIYVDASILEEAGIITEDEDRTPKGTAVRRIATMEPASGASDATDSPLDALNRDLQLAIDTENYEKAARIRDQIQRLKG